MPKLTYAIQRFDHSGLMRPPYQVCKGFAAIGWDVQILTLATTDNIDLDVAWDCVPIRKVNGHSEKVRMARLAAQLFQRDKTDVVVSSIWDWHCFSLAAAHRLFGSPYVLMLDTYTHLHPQNYTDGRSKTWQKLRYGIPLVNANILLAETPVVQKFAQLNAPGPEVLLAPSCLWLKDIRDFEASSNQQEIRDHHPFILFSGRVVERKGVHDLIEAFSRVAEEFSNWRVEVRGAAVSPAYGELLQAQVKDKGLVGRVKFEPSLTGNALYQRYRDSSIYCLPSMGEGFPGTILEAMAFGGVIIAAESGYVGYQLDHGRCGILFKHGDVDALTRELRLMMSSMEVRTKYRQAARARLEDLFVWERYFELLRTKFFRLTQGS